MKYYYGTCRQCRIEYEYSANHMLNDDQLFCTADCEQTFFDLSDDETLWSTLRKRGHFYEVTIDITADVDFKVCVNHARTFGVILTKIGQRASGNLECSAKALKISQLYKFLLSYTASNVDDALFLIRQAHIDPRKIPKAVEMKLSSDESLKLKYEQLHELLLKAEDLISEIALEDIAGESDDIKLNIESVCGDVAQICEVL